MNTTEQMYYEDYLVSSDKYEKILFEAVKFILVHRDPTTSPSRRESTYTPDFWCLCHDGTIEIHEVKGLCDEADRLKIKMCAEKHPEFKWVMAHSGRKREFKLEEF